MAKKRKSIQQQVKSVQDRYKQTMVELDQRTESIGTQIAIVVQSRAQYYTPLDTNALINSQYREIKKDGNKWVVRIGYTQNYAAPLHSPETKMVGWKPRPPDSPGKRGGGYNPNAREGFLTLGLNESEDNIQQILKAGYKT